MIPYLSMDASPDYKASRFLQAIRINSVLQRVEEAGLARMVEADKYCIDIIQQVSAAQGALLRVSQGLLDSRLRTCLVTTFKTKGARARDTGGEGACRAFHDNFTVVSRREL